MVIHDKHPHYSTTRLAREMAEEFGIEAHSVQHHHAHGAALLAEHRLEEISVLALDGAGYGDDKTLWGGEILYINDGAYQRIGHLKKFPLLGGDMAAKEPLRILLSMVHACGGNVDAVEIEGRDLLVKIAKTSPMSTSFGRTLDAIAAAGGVCNNRSYRGEPAMLMERYLTLGETAQPAKIGTSNGVIDGAGAVCQLNDSLIEGGDFSMLSAAVVKGFLKEMVKIALTKSSNVGMTGGVSYSTPISKWFFQTVEEQGGIPYLHKEIPPGDGGVSVGQAYLANYF
ncbi:MAG TPA: hypothetical protein ENN76_00265 [Euryarchaeota archaeon]|nr:hypothetical protein [Euryarchaeota archaeon]